jgi:hypothetical protein
VVFVKTVLKEWFQAPDQTGTTIGGVGTYLCFHKIKCGNVLKSIELCTFACCGETKLLAQVGYVSI